MRIDFEQGHVRLGIGAHQFGAVFAFVVEQHFDVVHTRQYMGIGEDIAVGTDDETRAEVEIFFGVLRLRRHIGHQPLKELVERIVVGKLALIHACRIGLVARARIARGLDIHHRRAFLLHQLSEIGQQHRHAAIFAVGFDGFNKTLIVVFTAKPATAFVAAAQQQNHDGGGEHPFWGTAHSNPLCFTVDFAAMQYDKHCSQKAA